MALSKTKRKVSIFTRTKSMYMWSWTVSCHLNIVFKKIDLFYLMISDISFLCEATTAALTNEQTKPSVQQRTTDKSAIRAVPNELQQEPVSDIFI